MKTYKLNKKRIREHFKASNMKITEMTEDKVKVVADLNPKFNQLRKNEGISLATGEELKGYTFPLWNTVIGILKKDFETRHVERIILSPYNKEIREDIYWLMEMKGYEEYLIKGFTFYKPVKMFAKKGEGVVLIEMTELCNKVTNCFVMNDLLFDYNRS